MCTVWLVTRHCYDDRDPLAVCATYDEALAVLGQQEHPRSCSIEKLTVGESVEDWTPQPVTQPSELNAQLKQWQDWGAVIEWRGYGYAVRRGDEERILAKVRDRAKAVEPVYPDVE